MNTVGSILGSLAAGFLFVPLWGSTAAIIFLACVNIVLAAVLFMLESSRTMRQKVLFYCAFAGAAVLVVGVLGRDPFMATIERKVYRTETVSASKAELMIRGTEIYSNKEGLEGTVTAFAINRHKQLWINGVGMTHLCTETKLMAHLPLMFTKNPKEFLIICFGMGTTVKSAALYPELNITAVELVSRVLRKLPPFPS